MAFWLFNIFGIEGVLSASPNDLLHQTVILIRYIVIFAFAAPKVVFTKRFPSSYAFASQQIARKSEFTCVATRCGILAGSTCLTAVYGCKVIYQIHTLVRTNTHFQCTRTHARSHVRARVRILRRTHTHEDISPSLLFSLLYLATHPPTRTSKNTHVHTWHAHTPGRYRFYQSYLV